MSCKKISLFSRFFYKIIKQVAVVVIAVIVHDKYIKLSSQKLTV